MSDEPEKRYATPLARRVKQGEFSDSGLIVETTLSEQVLLVWSAVIFLFIGKVEKQPPQQPGKSGPKLNVIRTTAALAAGPIGTAVYDLASAKGKQKAGAGEPRGDSFFLLDLYVSGSEQPFRFDSVGTNFKAFLKEEAGYASDLNFLNFVRKLSPFTLPAQDTALVQFLERGRNAVPVFASRDQFAWRSFDRFRQKRS